MHITGAAYAKYIVVKTKKTAGNSWENVVAAKTNQFNITLFPTNYLEIIYNYWTR